MYGPLCCRSAWGLNEELAGYVVVMVILEIKITIFTFLLSDEGCDSFPTAVSDIPRGTLRSSQNHHLMVVSAFTIKGFSDYISFIRQPKETKAVVSITGIISVVKYIANLPKL